MIPILVSSPRARVASVKCFPVQDLPSVLRSANSEARLKRAVLGNRRRIRPGRTMDYASVWRA
jgi:hypothetical protein